MQCRISFSADLASFGVVQFTVDVHDDKEKTVRMVSSGRMTISNIVGDQSKLDSVITSLKVANCQYVLFAWLQ